MSRRVDYKVSGEFVVFNRSPPSKSDLEDNLRVKAPEVKSKEISNQKFEWKVSDISYQIEISDSSGNTRFVKKKLAFQLPKQVCYLKQNTDPKTGKIDGYTLFYPCSSRDTIDNPTDEEQEWIDFSKNLFDVATERYENFDTDELKELSNLEKSCMEKTGFRKLILGNKKSGGDNKYADTTFIPFVYYKNKCHIDTKIIDGSNNIIQLDPKYFNKASFYTPLIGLSNISWNVGKKDETGGTLKLNVLQTRFAPLSSSIPSELLIDDGEGNDISVPGNSMFDSGDKEIDEVVKSTQELSYDDYVESSPSEERRDPVEEVETKRPRRGLRQPRKRDSE